ncbi:MAG: hypothetical protein MUC28_04195 [Planctomycetes bacterium]|nr:hypothetical protein [Planctomycetota bacterium]
MPDETKNDSPVSISVEPAVPEPVAGETDTAPNGTAPVATAEPDSLPSSSEPPLTSPATDARPEEFSTPAASEPVPVPAEEIAPAGSETVPSAAEAAEPEPLVEAKSEKPVLAPAETAAAPASPSWLDQLRNILKANIARGLLKRRQKKAERLEKIMAYARAQGKITNNDVERLTGVKDRCATDYLNLLVKQNRLVRFGANNKTFYKAVD